MPQADLAGSPYLWDDIGRLILTTGTDTFEPLFYETCRKAFVNDQCNVFVFDQDLETSPRCVFSNAVESDMRRLTFDMSREYVAKGYRSDPTLAWVRSRGLTRQSRHVRVVSRQQIGNTFYRSRFYDHAMVRQKLAMVSHSDNMVLYLNFYRNPDQSEYRSEDHTLLNVVGGTLAGLVQKHLRLTAKEARDEIRPVTELTPAYRERLLSRVRDVLLGQNAGLTQREAEVCAAIAIGFTTEGIGLTLGISVNTVATHRKRAYAKLRISSQSELFARHHEAVAREFAALRSS